MNIHALMAILIAVGLTVGVTTALISDHVAMAAAFSFFWGNDRCRAGS
jgi:demethoxyubiquinone hydroxylase (CLK1/Coq7/Cat5 family)